MFDFERIILTEKVEQNARPENRAAFRPFKHVKDRDPDEAERVINFAFEYRHNFSHLPRRRKLNLRLLNL